MSDCVVRNRKIIQISNSSKGITLDQNELERAGIGLGDVVDVELTIVKKGE